MNFVATAVAGFLPRRDLERRQLQTWLSRSAKMPQRDQRWWSGPKSARSARTRRIVWSARRWPQRGTSGVKSSLDQKWSLVKYRDVSVKHATSPSHRDRSRQVVIL